MSAKIYQLHTVHEMVSIEERLRLQWEQADAKAANLYKQWFAVYEQANQLDKFQNTGYYNH